VQLPSNKDERPFSSFGESTCEREVMATDDETGGVAPSTQGSENLPDPGAPEPTASDKVRDEEPGEGTPRSRKPLFIAVVGVVIVVGAIALTLIMRGGSSSHTINGTLTLTDSDFNWSVGKACTGSGGYSDISEGADVTVKNESGRIIANATLEAGTGAAGPCLFPFHVKGVPDAKFYAIEISHRGELRYSKDELAKQNWIVLPSLGSNS
jgi:hypothetical protein